MIKYKELINKTMPPDKKAKASRCIIGHYLIRLISNIISIPLIERKVIPVTVTILSGFFVLIAYVPFSFISGGVGFWIGWLSILIWNILDGVDGNIARYNNQCSGMGELWDAAVGWFATITFYVGMGYVAYYHPGGLFNEICLPNTVYLILGFVSSMCWIFPRLVMHKKKAIMGE